MWLLPIETKMSSWGLGQGGKHKSPYCLDSASRQPVLSPEMELLTFIKKIAREKFSWFISLVPLWYRGSLGVSLRYVHSTNIPGACAVNVVCGIDKPGRERLALPGYMY